MALLLTTESIEVQVMKLHSFFYLYTGVLQDKNDIEALYVPISTEMELKFTFDEWNFHVSTLRTQLIFKWPHSWMSVA